MKTYGEVDTRSHVFLTSALEEVISQLHMLAVLTQGKGLGIRSIGDWVGSRAGTGDVMMRKLLT
jgi:hypothetical protein